MRPLKELEQAYKYQRTMESQHMNEANRLEKCLLCVKAKTYKACPDNCPYLVKS